MTSLAVALIAGPAALAFYAYAGYPLLLKLIAAMRPDRPAPPQPAEWPMISITVPVYNEAAQVPGLIESLLALDYPAERRQILIVSDASTDGTDDLVRAHADRGIELLRLVERGGKTVAERAAAQHLRGEIVVNTDASIRIDSGALKHLVAAFGDPSVGVASGRDISVSAAQADMNAGEGGYVSYEMAIRRLETRVSGIVGASGCFYAIRDHLHREPLPDWLSRDFASAMIARRSGYRSVSVDDAICFVPRAGSLDREYRRKVRTMTRGMETLHHMRALLNPFRYGAFAWMLVSHKICRWLVPWGAVSAAFGLTLLAPSQTWAAGLLSIGVLLMAAGALGWVRQKHGPLPRWLAVPTYLIAGNIAALHAGIDAIRGDRNALWEPTRRDAITLPTRKNEIVEAASPGEAVVSGN